MALRTLSVCAGVGGLDLGVRIARPDARCVAFVEREASAAASLVASMEAGRLHPAAVWSDLRTFDAPAWRGAVDCVLSGDPCQGNSVAGKRLGADDDRWLLDRAIEVFDQSGAHTFFRENVPGNLDGQLAVAVPALEGLGCRVACGIFSAAEAEASHRRERLFILAYRPSVGREGTGSVDQASGGRRRPSDSGSSLALAADQRHEWTGAARGRWPGSSDRCCSVADPRGGPVRYGGCESPSGAPNEVSGEVWEQRLRADAGADRRGHGSAGDVAHTGGQRAAPGLSAAARGHGERAESAVSYDGGRRLPIFAPGPSDQRWPDIIARAPHLEPAVRRVADGLANRTERLRHCGNGVVPLAAALAWVRLHALLAEQAAGSADAAAGDRAARAGGAVVRAAA